MGTTCPTPSVVSRVPIEVCCACIVRMCPFAIIIAVRAVSAPCAGVGRAMLYDALGIDSSATFRDVRVAFKRRALAVHPDKGGDLVAVERRHAMPGFEHLIMSDGAGRGSAWGAPFGVLLLPSRSQTQKTPYTARGQRRQSAGGQTQGGRQRLPILVWYLPLGVMASCQTPDNPRFPLWVRLTGGKMPPVKRNRHRTAIAVTIAPNLRSSEICAASERPVAIEEQESLGIDTACVITCRKYEQVVGGS